MLTYADVYCSIRASVRSAGALADSDAWTHCHLRHPHARLFRLLPGMLTYADVCWRRTSAGRMLTYADVCYFVFYQSPSQPRACEQKHYTERLLLLPGLTPLPLYYSIRPPPRYSVYLLYWYKRTHTDATGAARLARHNDARFTCFTGARVHILTQQALQGGC